VQMVHAFLPIAKRRAVRPPACLVVETEEGSWRLVVIVAGKQVK
jgi:hypothetical protein